MTPSRSQEGKVRGACIARSPTNAGPNSRVGRSSSHSARAFSSRAGRRADSRIRRRTRRQDEAVRSGISPTAHLIQTCPTAGCRPPFAFTERIRSASHHSRAAYYGCSTGSTTAEDFSAQGYSGYSISRPAAAVLPRQFGLDRVLVGDAPLDFRRRSTPARRGSAPARTSPSRLPALLHSAKHAVATCDSDGPARNAATAAVATRKPRLLR